jgi:1-acyl-sn-glycerol-3-phosphate acyltransferase
MQKLAQLLLKLMGWKIVGELPKQSKYVLIVAPHTSNWDLVIGLIARFAVGVRMNFLAKHQVFFFPLGPFLRAMGGAPVDRSKIGNVVEQSVEIFNQHETFVLGLAPEGTRSPVNRWKEGFYHIAYAAKVPIALVGFDYPSKEIRLREAFWPTGDVAKDFPEILDYYRTIRGRHAKDIPYYHPK